LKFVRGGGFGNINRKCESFDSYREQPFMTETVELRLDKTAFVVASLFDDPDEKDFWQTKSPQERLGAVELLRQIHYGYDPLTARLQRVLEVAGRSSS
jgi:hypothetical protein